MIQLSSNSLSRPCPLCKRRKGITPTGKIKKIRKAPSRMKHAPNRISIDQIQIQVSCNACGYVWYSLTSEAAAAYAHLKKM